MKSLGKRHGNDKKTLKMTKEQEAATRSFFEDVFSEEDDDPMDITETVACLRACSGATWIASLTAGVRIT